MANDPAIPFDAHGGCQLARLLLAEQALADAAVDAGHGHIPLQELELLHHRGRLIGIGRKLLAVAAQQLFWLAGGQIRLEGLHWRSRQGRHL